MQLALPAVLLSLWSFGRFVGFLPLYRAVCTVAVGGLYGDLCLNAPLMTVSLNRAKEKRWVFEGERSGRSGL
ncbi:hypothetical protein LZ30DRAFT_714662 [Colletotrichum cereale]|nr:hypothetical protein LZ30DRAFT_714662 [Colletotrichum cereale]